MPPACFMAEAAATATPGFRVETARLILRDWRDEDVAPFLRHLNQPDVMRWLGGVQSDADARAAIGRIRAGAAQTGHCFWIVERRSDSEILGFCGLKRVNAPTSPSLGDFEIGWRLRADAHGMGYAREAAEAALDAAFHQFDAPYVVAFTVAQNAASWGLMQRLGMTRAPDLDFIDDRWGPEIATSIVYKIDRKDWTQ